MEQIVGPKTNFIPRQPNDTGVAGAKHLDLDSATKAKLLESVHMVGVTQHPRNHRRFAGRQLS